jgi:hypothetical protein
MCKRTHAGCKDMLLCAGGPRLAEGGPRLSANLSACTSWTRRRLQVHEDPRLVAKAVRGHRQDAKNPARCKGPRLGVKGPGLGARGPKLGAKGPRIGV